MDQFNNIIINRHLTIGRVLGLVITAIVISLLLPRTTFKYDFELGNPWVYDDFKAPFDFGVQKSPEELESERANVIEEFIPHYQKNNGFKNLKIAQASETFIDFYERSVGDSLFLSKNIDSSFCQKKVNELLSNIYDKGVIRLEENHNKEQQKIAISKEGIAEIVPVKSLFTPPQAYQFIQTQIGTLGSKAPIELHKILLNNIAANVVYDEEVSSKILATKLERVIPIRGKVKDGEKIITNGQLVDKESYQKLLSLKMIYDARKMAGNQWWDLLGYFLVLLTTLVLFLMFVKLFNLNLYNSLRQLNFIYILLIGFFALFKLVTQFEISSFIYAVPFCILPIIMRNFFGIQIALMFYVMVLLLLGFVVPVSDDFLWLQFVAGLTALFLSKNTYYWSHLFTSIGYIFLTYALGIIVLHLIRNNGIEHFDFAMFVPIIVNVLLTLLAFPFIPLVERLFGFVSKLTLVELGDVNQPLLKELSNKAPGSFWHSIQVASLAEKVATAVKADPLLAKVGALYHDVGKINQPLYFIENQNTEFNPHDELAPKESTDIIINHVRRGIELAKKHKLPSLIVDFIRTHHGTTRTEYFYKKYIEANPNENVDEKEFRYPGPLPYSRETAIVMLADSIEAASMSLENPTLETIDELVDNIIQYKINEKQLENCDLSFKDLRIASEIFKKLLHSKFHIRVKY